MNRALIFASRTALCGILGMGAFSQALLAQDAPAASGGEDAVFDEIVVTGKRASLERSLATKREARSVLDSISAEELGKFPDANVADSLQHITGITISRGHGGEGQYVTVRGLPPQYSIVTLNNRILATDDDGRDFAFDVLPSEVISGADVLKSPVASALEGSIGGSVNLRSARPLDRPGFNASVRGEGDYNSLSEDLGYKFSGVISQTFKDDTVGVQLGVTYADRSVRSDGLGEMHFNQDWPSAADIGAEGQLGSADVLTSPCCYSIGTWLEQKKRWAVSGALQFRPNDKFEMTLDGLFTRLDSPASGYNEAFYVEYYDESDAGEFGNWSDIVIDNGLVTGMTVHGLVPEQVTRVEHRVVDTYQVGWNGKYDFNESFRAVGDIYYSKAKRLSGGKDSWVVAGAAGDHTGHFSLNENGLPNITIELEDGRSLADLGNDDYGVHWAELGGTDVHDEVFGSTLDFEANPDMGLVSAIKFGGAYTKRTKKRDTVDNLDNACNYCDYPFTFGDVGVDVVRPLPVDNFMSGVDGDFPREFVVFDLDAYWAALRASDGQTINGITYPENYSDLMTPVRNPVKSYGVKEETWAGYVQADFEGDNWFANVGGRLIHSKTSVDYAVNEITSIVFVDSGGATSHYDVTYSEAVPKSGSGSYTKFLPSMNFGYWMREDLILRFAAAKTMARPSLNQLAPTREDYAYDGDFSIYVDGNVDLKPIKANQMDLAVEWYFKEGSALTGALFWKDISGFVTSQASYDVPIAGQEFYVEAPVNGESAKVKGFEVGLQYFFDNGFGIIANYTYTDTKAKIGGVEEGLEGVSKHAYSLAGIYANDKFEAMISADYSGKTIVSLFSPIEGVPSTGEAVTWVSASLSYHLTDHIDIYAKGNNLTNAKERSYLGDPRLVSGFESWGRSFFLGASYNF
ncbi:TonB-dependent receptor [Pseudokordiimonas caeni]|uniref:TonB-dependent receptor n=1 Tax=Pseudokordiimonas caeni TaxID=2997908 RepID=UPI00281259F0|nr:TonB-dependent receptor [Pseudokordiimonas caeni]